MKTRRKRSLNQSGSNAQLVASSSLQSRLLPDEIVKEIICQSGLVISETDFRSTDGKCSPFADPTHVSNSAILVVCKQWLRVATPLLYQTVVLRSKAQAEALRSALTRKNKALGTYIKWLRLEGHYGAVMKNILEAAPNITDLCLTISLWAHESASGLVKLLPTMQPKRLILYDMDPIDSKHPRSGTRAKELLNALSECIDGKWTALEDIHYTPRSFRDLDSVIVKSLRTAPALRTLHVEAPERYYGSLETICTNPSLKTIQVPRFLPHVLYFRSSSPIWSMMQVNGRSWRSLSEEYSLNPNPHNTEPLSPPRPASSIFDDKIWKHILGSVLQVTYEDTKDKSSFQYNCYQRLTWAEKRLKLLLTCKTFYRLGVDLLHSGIIIGWDRIPKVAQHINDHQDVTRHIKHFIVYAASGRESEQAAARQPLLLEMFSKLLQQLRLVTFGSKSRYVPNVLQTFPLHWDSFEALCAGSSSTLLYLHPVEVFFLPDDGSPILRQHFFSPFANLRNIRTLAWISSCTITIDDSYQIPSDILSTLEELEYEEKMYGGQQTFLAALSQVSLPSLKVLKYHQRKEFILQRDAHHSTSLRSFLIAHGPKISQLHLSRLDLVSPFEYCSNMTIFTLEQISSEYYKAGDSVRSNSSDRDELYNRFFRCSFQHSSLRKIVVREESHCGGEFVVSDGESCKSCIWHPSTYTSFPSLREIQIPGLVHWPSSDREMKVVGYHWPERAEKLHEGHIRLTDEQGKHWIPRLKRKEGRKKGKERASGDSS